MNENRRQILEMLAAGKITAEEAERLLVAVESDSTPTLRRVSGKQDRKRPAWTATKTSVEIFARAG